jgi:ElaB/YqjD/DUF883 family membrane-anchored ribosome-binding protein
MSNIGGSAQAQTNKPGHTAKSSDLQDVRDSISDLGSSVGDMANRQYQRAQDMTTDAIDETSLAIQRNPLAAIGIGLGVGFLLGVIMTGGRHH